MAKQVNLKPPADIEYDEELRSREDIDMPAGGLPEYINDYQLFRSCGRQLQLLSYQYRISETDDQLQYYYDLLVQAYDECINARDETLSWLTWDESRQTILDEFRTMQEAALEVYHIQHERFPLQRTDIFNRMMQIHLQANRDDDWHTPYPSVLKKKAEKKEQTSPTSPAFDMQLIQVVNWVRLRKLNKKSKEKITTQEYRDFGNIARQLIKGDKETTKERIKKGKPNPKMEEIVNIEGIFNNFNDGNARGAVVSIFGGNKSLFALCLFEAAGRIPDFGSIQSIVLNKGGNQYKKIQDIKKYAENLTKAITAIHTRVKEELDEDSPIKESPFFEELLCTGKIRLHSKDNSDNSEIDRLNTELLVTSYEVYQHLIKPLNIPEHTKRIYLTFNQGHLQTLPLNLLCLKDPSQVFSTEEYRPFSHMQFFGRKYQNAIIPSLQGLWRMRDPMNEEKANNSSTEPSDILRFLSIYGSEEPGLINYSIGHNSINKEGTTSMKHIRDEILVHRKLKNGQYKFRPVPGTSNTHGKGAKKEILKDAEWALIVHFFCHVNYDRTGRFSSKKIILHEFDKNKIDELDLNRLRQRLEQEIYPQEVSEREFINCFLVFINGCGSASGRIRPGDIPESMMAAFFEAGARGAIGTHYPTYIKQGSMFAEVFYNQWFNFQNGQEFTIGKALQRTIDLLLTRDKMVACAHPLHWGSYIYMGNTTLKLSAVLDHANRPVEEE